MMDPSSGTAFSAPRWTLGLPAFTTTVQIALLRPRQTPLVRLVRVALVPLCIYLCFHEWDNVFEPHSELVLPNFIIYIYLLRTVMNTLEAGMKRDAYTWIGYEAAMKDGILLPKQQRQDSPERCLAQITNLPEIGLFSLENAQYTLSLVTSARGIGWDWGIRGNLIAPPYSQEHFLKETLTSFLVQLLVITPSSLIQQWYGDDPESFRFHAGLPELVERWVARAVLALAVGLSSWIGMELLHTIVSLAAYAGTAALRMLPLPAALTPSPFDARAWPPLFQNSWASTSIADLWSYRWHSIMRYHTVLFGYRPARYMTGWCGKTASQSAAILAGFAVPAFVHAIPWCYASASRRDLAGAITTSRFFLCQGLAAIMEGLFTSVTGRRVGGWPGRLWVLGVQAWLVPGLWAAWLKGGMQLSSG